MGAWSVEPGGSDEAMEWLANAIEYPLVQAIGNALSAYLADPSEDLKKFEAEMAVALLTDLTMRIPALKYTHFDIHDTASQQNVWEKADAVINALRSDEKWLTQWVHSEEKKVALALLVTELEKAKEGKKVAAPN